MSVGDEIAQYIRDQHLADGINVFVDREEDDLPDDDAMIVNVVEYPGEGSTRVLCAAPASELPRIQLVVRGARDGDDAARRKIEAIYQALDRIVHQTLSTTPYIRVTALQPPFRYKRDTNERMYFAANFRIQKRLSAT